MNKIITC